MHKFIFLLIVFIWMPVIADDPVIYINNANPLSYYSAKYEMPFLTQHEYDDHENLNQERKSSFKAGFFSALLPGSGEYYAKSYWRAALFTAVEVAFVSGYFIYENKGKDEDRKMKDYGNTHWSEQRYWSRVYRIAVENGEWNYEDLQTDANDVIINENYDQETIERLRDVERNSGISGFTHSLPETKTQQYYEMIYKYLHQFGPGWDDVPFPAYYETQAYPYNLTPNISEYRSMRNRSNDYYATATTMTSIVLLNHVISAFDAALAAKSYNKKVAYSFHLSAQRYAGELVRTYGLRLSW